MHIRDQRLKKGPGKRNYIFYSQILSEMGPTLKLCTQRRRQPAIIPYPIREYKIQSPLTVEVSFNLRGVGFNIRVIVQGCKRNWGGHELPVARAYQKR